MNKFGKHRNSDTQLFNVFMRLGMWSLLTCFEMDSLAEAFDTAVLDKAETTPNYPIHKSLEPPDSKHMIFKFIFLFFLLANWALCFINLFVQYIHRAICRPSDRPVEIRIRAEIRTREGRIYF